LTGTQPNHLREGFPRASANLTLYIIKLREEMMAE